MREAGHVCEVSATAVCIVEVCGVNTYGKCCFSIASDVHDQLDVKSTVNLAICNKHTSRSHVLPADPFTFGATSKLCSARIDESSTNYTKAMNTTVVVR